MCDQHSLQAEPCKEVTSSRIVLKQLRDSAFWATEELKPFNLYVLLGCLLWESEETHEDSQKRNI